MTTPAPTPLVEDTPLWERILVWCFWVFIIAAPVIGLVGRCMGWSDPSAPTQFSKAEAGRRAKKALGAAGGSLDGLDLDDGDGPHRPRARVSGSESLIAEKEMDEVGAEAGRAHVSLLEQPAASRLPTRRARPAASSHGAPV